jgi:3-isopropylmalate/(R)-2-methylmalate dehydratase small subunit
MTSTTLQLKGRSWVFGDNIDTDLLAPGHAMRKPIEQLSGHCLEAISPEFATSVRRGDILVAGDGFGAGSSREQAAEALLFLGISAVLARSVARIFYRNALNLGLPVVRFADAAQIGQLDLLSVDLVQGRVQDLTTLVEYRHEPIPPFLLDMLLDGGLLPHLHKRLHPRAPQQG